MTSSRIAVITPYYKESLDFLWQCHESVKEQTIAARHFMIADGFPVAELDSWDIDHVKLSASHSDNGNTPRGIGALLAEAQGFDFIAFLDADNWFYPNHLRTLIETQNQTKADICTSFRTFHAWNGDEMSATERFEDKLLHVDTSCYLLTRAAFRLNGVWLKMPSPLSPLCDRVFLQAASQAKMRIASTRQRTVAFRSQYKSHYDRANCAYPLGLYLKTDTDNQSCRTFLKSELGIRQCIEHLGFWPVL